IHEIVGLKKNFNSGCICRWCYAKTEEIQDERNFDVNNFAKRTKESWEENLKSNSLEFGIKRPYIFYTLNSFEISKSLPPDVMHDLHEGILPCFLQKFFEKICSINERNVYKQKYKAIKWKYGDFSYSDQNIPIIKGKAAKVFELCDYPKYLEKIVVNRLCGRFNTEEMQRLLKNTSIDFYKDYKLYVDNIFPKLHYLCHYSDLMATFGPLWKFSTMRYERKHNYFKQLAQKIRNSINITLSLSERHSRLQRICLKYPKIANNILHFNAAPHIENEVDDENLIEVKKIFLCEIQIETVDATETLHRIHASRYVSRRFILPLFSYEIQDINESFVLKYYDILNFRCHSAFSYKDKICIPKICEV
ncbi:hypothetical protein B4U79_06268, partial [Dinothrombium tinctorium]